MIEHDKCIFFVIPWVVKYEKGMQKHSKEKEHGKGNLNRGYLKAIILNSLKDGSYCSSTTFYTV
jgi:hypothetical protein